MRIALFILTNLAVVLVASIVLKLLGVDGYMARSGLQYGSLLAFCAVFGMTGSIISLLISKWMAKRSMGVYVIEQPRNGEEKWLIDTVAELAHKAGIGMPEVGIFPSDQSNAFATGASRNNALVAVSAGMLRRFNKDEIKAVLGHEIGHVANGDMITLTLIQGVVNTFVMFFARIIGYAVDSALRKDGDDRGPGIGFMIATFVAEMVLGILASMIVAWFSRRREFRADHAGATLASRFGMIGALQRLAAESGQPVDMPAEMTAFGLRNGSGGLAHLFATHPPLDVRIRALQNA
jgi:heat shock protein HtpX